jgi:AbrB family looped-hinge helix DNA binding protein
MAIARITSKGRVTIPKAVREHLRVAEGDLVDFRIAGDGTVRLAPHSLPASRLFGMLHRPGMKPVSVEEMDAAIAAEAEASDRRTRTPGASTGHRSGRAHLGPLPEMPPELVWDYETPPDDRAWRLQRIADWFPAFGRDRETVAQLYAYRHELNVPPEVRSLIEIYEEVWREREAGRGDG